MIFDSAKILEIHEAAILWGFGTAREVLLFGIGEAYVSKIPTWRAPSDQLLEDLNYMNERGREGKMVPLALWLRNAAYRVKEWPERAQMFKQLEEQAYAAAPEGWIGVPRFFRSNRLPVVATTGGLDASAKESLISAMCECLLLEDLQTTALRCFGDLPIRPVEGSQAPAVRDVALQCVDLAERQQMAAVFCRAVLHLERCDEPLRQKLLQLYPELLDADRPFSEIVDVTSGFLASNAARISALLGNETLMNEISLLVSKLRCYKGLHEALHQVKNNPLPRIPEQSSPSADRKFRQDVRQFLTLLNTAREKSDEALAGLPVGNDVRDSEKPWTTLIGGCAQRISAALNPTDDFGRVETELERAAVSLNRLEEFNERIIELARRLLHGPLVTLRDKLLADGLGDVVLSEAMTAMDALRLALHVRVLEHTRWQETDSVLFLLDDTLKVGPAAAFTKFTRQWGVVRRQLPLLTDAEGQIDLWRLRQLALRVDSALTRIEGSLDNGTGDAREDLLMLMSEPYDAFRYEAQQQFLRIDAGLKRNCSDLSRIA